MSFFKVTLKILLITIASASSFYPNSTSSIASNSSDAIITSVAAASSSDTSWTSTCLYNPGEGYGDCNRAGDPIIDEPWNPYDTNIVSFSAVNPSLLIYCSQQFDSDFSQWEATASITTEVTTEVYTGYTPYTQGPSGSFSLYSTQIDTTTQSYVFAVDSFQFTAAVPCCLGCTLYGGNVQVYYWPTPAITPAVSTLVNTAGFTFISPSVYVAFESLQAIDLCGNVGQIYNATTIAFNEAELSTGIAWTYSSNPYDPFVPFPPETFYPATWGDQTDCANITTSFWQGYGPTTYSDYAAASEAVGTSNAMLFDDLYLFTITYNPCSPTLSVPSELYTLNSLWTDCLPGISGFYDPPYPLSTGNGLIALTASDPLGGNNPPQVATSDHTSASAGPTPPPPTAISTKPPFVVSTSAITNDPLTQSYPTAAGDDPPGSSTNNVRPTQSPEPSANNAPLQSSSGVENDPPALSPGTSSNGPPSQPSSVVGSNPPQQPAVANIAGSTITADSASAFIYGTYTLTPGGQATISGTTYSLATNGEEIAIGTSTTQLLGVASSPTQYVLGTQTLIAGDPAITVSGTVLSLLPGASSVAIDGNTQAASVLLSASSVPEYLVGTQTLKAGGPAITVSGTVISLASGGSSVLVDGKTEALTALLGAATPTGNPNAIETPGQGLGAIIASLGGFATPVSTSSTTIGYTGFNGTVFTGGSYSMKRVRGSWILGSAFGLVLVGVWML